LELADYFRILRRRGWIIVLVAAMTAASAWGFSKLQTPVYKASVNVSINPSRIDWGSAQTVKILLRNYVTVINSKKWAGDVISRKQLDMTPDQLKSNVTVASDDSRLTIQIDVKDYDPGQAALIADDWALMLVEWREQENAHQLKEDQVHAYQIDPATWGLFSPKTKINTIAGGIFGLLLAGVIIFFLEWVESGIVRSAQDVERHLDLTILGAVPPTRQSS
jgi:capsular polysaccharide biosynthesis protein